MNLEHELEKELLRLKNKQQKLTVKWNAGGDDTIVDFLINGESIGWSRNELYSKLEVYLVKKIDLPNVGEYYNNGDAEFKYSEEEERIKFTFNELAHHEIDANEEIETHLVFTEMKYPIIEEAIFMLKEFKKSSAFFDGSISFERNQKEYFNLNFYIDKENKYSTYLKKIQLHISSILRQNYKGDTENIELRFEGDITMKEIIFDDLFIFKTYVDKNHKNVTINLFEDDDGDF